MQYNTTTDQSKANMNMQRHNTTSQNEQPISTSPLPFITQAAPVVSELNKFLQSTFLFPKTFSSPRMMMNNNDSNNSGSGKNIDTSGKNSSNSSCINDGVFSAEAAPKNIEEIAAAANQEQTASKSISSPSKTAEKKSVRFNPKVSVHRVHALPPSSSMTPREKARIWYNSTYYDQFKYEAAKSAGVKIIRYDTADDDAKAAGDINPEKGQGHHFVMMGDFDSKQGSKSSKASSSGTSTSSKSTSKASGKCYYNENEYNDQQLSIPASTEGSSGLLCLGEVICKRGLGYHFSRSRKKSRVVTRSAVMAWQKTLRDAKARPADSDDLILPSDMEKLSSSSSEGTGLDKTQMMLALVSTKCSRVAREEARWRGDVDYRVAHPERHAPTARASKTASRSPRLASSSSSSLSSATHRMSNCTTANNRLANGKRSNGMVMLNKSDVDVPMNSCHKRQRTNQVSLNGCGLNSGNTDGGGDRDELSPNTIGLLSGVLHAEV